MVHDRKTKRERARQRCARFDARIRPIRSRHPVQTKEEAVARKIQASQAMSAAPVSQDATTAPVSQNHILILFLFLRSFIKQNQKLHNNSSILFLRSFINQNQKLHHHQNSYFYFYFIFVKFYKNKPKTLFPI